MRFCLLKQKHTYLPNSFHMTDFNPRNSWQLCKRSHSIRAFSFSLEFQQLIVYDQDLLICVFFSYFLMISSEIIPTLNWGGLRGLRDPPKTQKSQKETPPETPLKSSGIATTLKPNSNPPKNFRDRPS